MEKGCCCGGGWCWADANQAEDSSLPVLERVRKWVVYSRKVKFQLSSKHEGKIENQIWNKKELRCPKAEHNRKNMTVVSEDKPFFLRECVLWGTAEHW